MPPAVSVIIPARNAGRFLGDALRSVVAQTVPVSEIVVVDDGSSDDTASVARAFVGAAAVRLVAREAGGGAAAARNAGVRHATGALLAFLDADDIWYPAKLERQLAMPGVPEGRAIAFGYCREFSDPPGRFPIRAGALAAPSFSSMLIARDAFLSVGLLREDLHIGELIEWLGRPAATALTQHMVAHAWFDRRVHAGNSTREAHDRGGAYLRILRERRHRAMAAAAI